MTDVTHTPGPWSQSHRETRDGMYSTEVYCADGETIAKCAWYPRPADPATGAIGTYREANARLIAAAPDLLAECENMLPARVCLTNKNIGDDFAVELTCTMGDLRRLAAAIAKARGQS